MAPVPFNSVGNDSSFYERHLIFDHIGPKAASARERGPSRPSRVPPRDILSQRWVLTEETYSARNPKRVYYLSMEFLIGRSLANNVTNLLLAPVARQTAQRQGLDWCEVIEQEPDAGLGNGGLGRLAACFLDSMATMAPPAMGYGLRYEYGIFKQSLKHGWQVEHPDNWLRHRDPWEVVRPHEKVGVKLNCSFEVSGGRLQAIPGRPSHLIGVPSRSPRRRLWRQDDQYIASLGGGCPRLLRFQDLQPR